MRPELSRPYGILFINDDALVSFLIRFNGVITVGDYVTSILRNRGVKPVLSVVDGTTRRVSFSSSITFQKEVRNPPSTISLEAFKVIAEALERRGGETIMVRGEEDMLVIPVLLLAPEGDVVVYGQPKAGAVALEVSQPMRWRASSLLRAMEVKEC
ncbi:GTP-dependent dephospho-CoA kinase family protein [Sulfodiicoccus acidiphilus]|nr:DUF359 domain-containing protein [Sulfodiicoccus acidiphilus]